MDMSGWSVWQPLSWLDGTLQGQVLGIGVEAAVTDVARRRIQSPAGTGDAGAGQRLSYPSVGKRSDVLVHPILCEKD